MKVIFRAFALIILSLSMTSSHLLAQEYTPSKKERKMMKCAIKKIDERKPEKAIEVLNKMTVKYPDNPNAYQQLAFIYAGKKKWEKAKSNMLKSLEINDASDARQLLYIANYCNKLQEISCEEEYLNQYIKHPKAKKGNTKVTKRLEAIKVKREIVKNSPEIRLEMLPQTINKLDENQYLSQLTVDGNTMIFTRRVNGQEDFFQSMKVDSVWTEAQAIPSLNTPNNEGAHTITGDGKILLFTKCNAGGPHKSCDIYISMKKGNGYTKPQPVGIINTSAWEAQPSISTDGNTIYFSSSRAGGQGLRDIYYVERIDKTWSEVKNMGDVINTAGDEETPFIHPDGRTLYFTSSGHSGMGGKDLFVSKKQADGSWSTPLNLGANINTNADEGGLSIDALGEYAYFSKTEIKDNKANTYIYRFELPDEFKPTPISYIAIQVFDAETNESIPAVLEFTNNGNTKTVNISKDGMVEVFESNQEYQLQIQKKGYLFYSKKIEPTESDEMAPIELRISLTPLHKEKVYDTPVILQNVTFATNSAELTGRSEKELLVLLNLLVENPNSRIRINGHTDNVGNEDDNLKLSKDRANSVKAFLLKKGINSSRIETKGYGKSKPIASNDTEEGRAMNRRTEFQIIK